ncbi:MAG: diacylglycerol kinase family lipid kinase [Chitinophagaceae bacterium]|nr:diacylglycerol kinase family lipid kinase [Chitinophagaceae bacterium]
MEETLFFIVNARTRPGIVSQLNDAIQKHLQGISTEIHCTEYGGHAPVLAQEALSRGIRHIVAVGGDGTVNEIVQVVAGKNAILSIIPAGSGNGLARHCNIPLNTDEAVALLKSGKPETIDLGRANDIWFISNAGVGFDAWVCNLIRQHKSRGLKMYVWEVFKNFFSYRPDTYQIVNEHETITEKAWFLNAANGREFGYGFQIATDAHLQDGMLDLIRVKSINLLKGAHFVWQGWRGKLRENRNCRFAKIRSVHISSPNLKYFQTDGDAHDCDGNCNIIVVPDALQLWVPKQTKTL